MNLKTTIFLAILVAAVGVGLLFQTFSSHGKAVGPTVEFLEKDLKPETLTRIEIGKGKVVLEKSGPGDWSLPGKWPVRTDETKELVQTLTALHTRFAPESLTDNADLKKYGLDHPLVVKVTVSGKEHTLEFGEEPNESNKFSRPTYVRLDDQKDIVRLAPGLVTVLDRPQKDYQLPRLFPYERVAKDNNPVDKVEQVAAKAITIQSPEGTIELTKTGSDWDISAPVKDHADTDKLKALLGAFPEIWAERFIDTKDKKLEDFGLKDPATILTVTKPSGGTIKLLIGGESDKKLRKVPRPAMPQQPFMPPKEDFDVVQDIYRYAKLEANDQVFEIKADALKDIQLNLAALRDSQLARFRTDAVKRLEIDLPMADASKKKDGSGTLVFVKDKDRWRMEKPKAGDAETAPIRELLDKLAGLQAKEKDVLDKADLKSLGLDTPEAQIKVTIEDEKGPKDKKTKTTREIVYDIGIQDKDKLYVMIEGWPRVNAVDEALLKLVKRPEMVYRNRHLLDVSVAELGKLEIVRGSEAYAFEQDKGTWKMIVPVKVDVDSAKVAKLAGELAKIEAVEFIADNPKDEDLEKVYGLVPPALTAKLTLADKDKPGQTVIFLGKPRGDKEYYARQANGPVFVVRKDLFSEIDRDSLVYRPLEILPGLKDKIKELAFQKDGQEFRLVQDGKDWKLRGPFDAPAAADLAEPIADEFASMKAGRFVAHEAKELKEYGLEKPYMTLRLVPAGKDDPEIQLQIGKPVEKKEKEIAKDKDAKDKDKDKDKGKDKESADEGGRYAKLASGPAVFVLSDRTIATFDKGPLDFLDKKMLALDVKTIQKAHGAGATSFNLIQKKDAWEVTDSPAPPFAAEEDAVNSFLRPWSNLRAEKIAAYGPKIDWAAFGLEKPGQTVSVTVAGDKDKTTEHQLFLGKEADKGLRFARLDKKDEVVILGAEAAAGLTSTYLDFINRAVLKFDLDTVTALIRQMPGGDMELVKREDSWRFAKPDADKPADDVIIGELLDKLFRLRAERIAAYPAKDLAPFGLDKPAAVFTIKLKDIQDIVVEHVIKIGKQTDDKKEERFAVIDKGESVIVLGAELSRRLVAPVLFFADRNLPGFASVDKAVLERPGRKLTFAHSDAGWSLTEPTKADAESADLDELTKSLRRGRAEEIVAQGEDNLKTYGLDRPEAHWHFYNTDKEVMSLLVGNADKEGRRYAILGRGYQIFTLNPKLSSRLVDEYRSRKPWPALDAVQVEKVTFNSGTSFTLQKKDAGWILPQTPDAKIDTKKVSDTLDALAGLKIARYVADANPDLKLYGLDPPVWTIEIETSAGKRTLQIGRQEGDSRRVYATVPGSGAVFIIGDMEAQRILRPLADYLAAEVK